MSCCKRLVRGALLGILMVVAGSIAGQARVVEFEVLTPAREVFDGTEFGLVGAYERIDARVEFAVDPTSARVAGIVDIDKAPVNDAGEVTFRTEVVILRPSDPARRSGVLLYEVPNRGRNLSFMLLNRGRNSNIPQAAEDVGDGFLMRQGYTLVWSGWQADIADDKLMQLELPVLEGVTGMSREEFIFDNDELVSRAALSYPAADLDTAKAQLTVRRLEGDARRTVEGLAFRYLSPTEIEITRPAELPQGAIYELVYPARDAVPAGLAFVGLSDLISFLRGREGHDAETPLTGIDHAMAIGISQSGRFLRDFIYQGFNADETGGRVFDGAMPHIAGSRKTFTNYRFAQPGRYSRQHEDHDFPGDQFPFTYTETTDPLTGRTDSIFAACRASGTCPKLIHTDTDTEFWQARASLLITDPAGNPVDMPEDVRLYYLAGLQHFTVWGGQSSEQKTCLFASNPAHGAPVMRALVKAMERWITNGTAPPASRFPSLADGTLVRLEELTLPSFGNLAYEPVFNPLQVMDHTKVPPERGAAYPVLVPAVDADGNALAGVEVPSVAAPLGTHYGWNLRKAGFGEGELCSLTGSFVPFARNAGEADGDLRATLEERYAGPGAYLDAVRSAAEDLVADGLMRADDIGFVLEQAQIDAAVLN